MAPPDVILEHPNRSKATVRLTRLIVILLLLVSAGLMAVVLIGGWDALAGQRPAAIGFLLIYVLLAIFAARWNRGVLPVSASLAIILAIFAAVSGAAWFARHKDGFTDPSLHADLLGTLCYLLIPVQILLIVFASRGFSQDWHVEVERHVEAPEDPHYGTTAPQGV